MGSSEENTKTPPRDEFNALLDAVRERLVGALEQTPPELFVRPFASAVATRSGSELEWVESFCVYLAEWFQLVSEDPTHFFSRVVDFLSSKADSDDKGTVDSVLRGQWERIMRADATLGVTLKAAEILRRQAHAFQNAVVTTEIRPVYLTDPNQPPANAIVLHQLHLRYQTEYGSQTVHIAVDGQAIYALQLVLDRALVKEKTLIHQKAYRYLGKATDAK